MRAIIIIILSFVYISGYTQKQTPPEGGVPKDFTLPAKTNFSLPNGVQGVMIPYGAIPKVNISIVIKTGNIHEGDQTWLSDITGELMKEGTTSRSAKDISIQAANMGGEVNVSVGPNQTTISGNVLSEFGADLVELLADIAMNPSFPDTEFDRIVNDKKRELSVALSSPQSQAQELFSKVIYGDHSYGTIFPTDELLSSFTLEQAKAFYENNFGGKRSTVYVAGVFKEESLKDAITTAFSKWKEGPDVSFDVPNLNVEPIVEVKDRPDAVQSTIVMGLPVVEPTHEDYIPLSITNYLLGGSFASRITSNIREDKGYTYSPYSTINSKVGTAVWYEAADVTTEVTGESLKEIAFEINRLANEVPSAEELKGIQNYRAGVFVLQNSSAGGIINQLAFCDLHGLPDTYLTEYVKNVYAVTPEVIQEMTSKYLDYQRMAIVVVGDKTKIDKQIEQYQQSIEEF